MKHRCLFSARTIISVTILLAATEMIYLPPSVLRGTQTLYGWDYMMLHIRRIVFARDALWGATHILPAWYSRELLGSPFSANLQNFPWIPTRLALLAVDPERAYGLGIAMAAALAAVFTYLYCRRAGLSQTGSVCAGWTFAAAGFFASRVEVGHLPLLEAYPSLPLLLLLADRAMDPERSQRQAWDMAAIALASACIAVAGHPQLPAYALTVTLLYILLRTRGWMRVRLSAAIALGAAATAVIWWPTLLLIQRSTRMLPLDPPPNDIVLPYRRLLSLVAPGVDGWPPGVALSAQHPFGGYAHIGFFWETAAYIGILPLIAAAGLVTRCAAQRRLPVSRWTFLGVLGGVALICSLPLVEPLRHLIPGTLLRSPARLLYLCTFSLAVALGAGVDAVLNCRLPQPRMLQSLLVVFCLAFHAWDLGRFARLFVHTVPSHELEVPEFEKILAGGVKDGRIAISRAMPLALAYNYDDAGGFDSIFLADPYRTLLAMSGGPARLNEQIIDAAVLSPAALQATGVRFVVTPSTRSDLDLVKSVWGLQLYSVTNSAPRAAFFTREGIRFKPRDQIPPEFSEHHSGELLLLAAEDLGLLPPTPAGLEASRAVSYYRLSSDEIVVRTSNSQAGFLYVVEAYDRGWTAKVDGVPVPIVEANGFGMAVPMSHGDHSVEFQYRTPGRIAGAMFSLLSVCLLAALVAIISGRTKDESRRAWAGHDSQGHS